MYNFIISFRAYSKVKKLSGCWNESNTNLDGSEYLLINIFLFIVDLIKNRFLVIMVFKLLLEIILSEYAYLNFSQFA